MSLASRFSSVLRSVLRSPAARRAARDIGRSVVDAVQDRRDGTSGGTAGRSGADLAQEARSRQGAPGSGPEAADGALADRPSSPPLALDYSPRDDEDADPGEIAWAWVPFEEDITRGKDRPVLVLARERDEHGEVLVALMLTSRDRGDAVHVDEHGATWVDIGTGAWDSRGRDSEVRADRLLRLRPASVRREGAKLSRERYDQVARVVREVHGWSL
ncbi:type II toxin-antitoxin system PemK/MazF family toxin [Brachybacterium phenoliresistens]|uniref:Growth inhibitor PemK n=1 Tax=Brachybacterium phenoliresistens TaxID=396014 RepID=Z9JW59_9MICO|nr:type II toxin-antitoxin system PemK/MazF family toxin [Brachybacterium phenoliresistens]EWS82605.1 hypothetical protein BF93_06105 [Brachybacterium phenoliresistens]